MPFATVGRPAPATSTSAATIGTASRATAIVIVVTSVYDENSVRPNPQDRSIAQFTARLTGPPAGTELATALLPRFKASARRYRRPGSEATCTTVWASTVVSHSSASTTSITGWTLPSSRPTAGQVVPSIRGR